MVRFRVKHPLVAVCRKQSAHSFITLGGVLLMSRYFQLRADDGERDPELYTSLAHAAEVLVRDNRLSAHVVELDIPGGIVVREFTRQFCEKIVRSASLDRT